MQAKLNFKLLGITLGAVVVLGGLVHLVHHFQVQRNASALLAQGDRAREAGQLQQALTYYQQFLGYNRDDLDTLEKVADLLDRQATVYTDRLRLIGLMEQVLHARPGNAALRTRLVHNLLLLDRYAEAQGHIQRLIEGDRNNAEFFHMLGWAQDANKQYRKAAGSFSAALALNPKRIETYLILAEMLQERLNEPDEAEATLREMVGKNPEDPRVYLARARYFQAGSRDAEAEADLRKAHRLDPKNPDVIIDVAAWKQRHGQTQEALQLLTEGLESQPKNVALIESMALLKMRLGKVREAVDLLQKALKEQPDATNLLVLLTDAQIDERQDAQAAANLERLRASAVAPSLVSFLHARLLAQRGELVRAIAELESARRQLQGKVAWSSRANALLGFCYHKVGDVEQELAAYRRAVQEEPSWTAARVNLSAALIRTGRLDEALAELDSVQLAKEVPSEYWPLFCRALLYKTLREPESRRDWTAVDEALGLASKAQLEGLELALLRAETLAARRDYAAAANLLEALKTRHRGDAALWCAEADLWTAQQKFAEAEKTLAQAQAELGDRLEFRLARCRIWGNLANVHQKHKLHELERNLGGLNLEARTRLRRELVDAWYRLGDFPQAARLGREIVRDQPLDVRSRFQQLDLALQMRAGQDHAMDEEKGAKSPRSEARRLIGELKNLEGPNGIYWRFGDAALLVQEAGTERAKLEEARKQLEALAARNKDWARVPLLLAQISERQGKTLVAIGEYRRAVELGETSPRITQRLVGLLLDRRDYQAAEDVLQLCLQKQPWTRELARLSAEVALGNQNPAGALLRAEQAVPRPSRDYRDYLWLARIYQGAINLDRKNGQKLLHDVEQMLVEANRLAPHAPDSWLALVEHYALAGREDKVDETLTRVQHEVPADRLDLTLARCLEAARRPAEAEAGFRAVLSRLPQDTIFLAAAADFFRRADNRAEAETLYRKLLEPATGASPEQVLRARRQLAALLGLSALEIDAKSLSGVDPAPLRKEAMRLVEANAQQIGETAADERLRWFIEGTTRKERAGAITRWLASMKNHPPATDELVLLAALYEAAANMANAREELAGVVAAQNRSAYYLARFIRVLIRCRDFDTASANLARLELLEPNTPRTNELKALLADPK